MCEGHLQVEAGLYPRPSLPPPAAMGEGKGGGRSKLAYVLVTKFGPAQKGREGSPAP